LAAWVRSERAPPSTTWTIRAPLNRSHRPPTPHSLRPRTSDSRPRYRRSRIDLSALNASGEVAGDLAFTWIGDSGFHKVAGELRQAIGADGNVYVYADTSGDGRADFELILLGAPQLAGSDFIL
jgi:hypothetical protein